jgi:hypothetical protein
MPHMQVYLMITLTRLYSDPAMIKRLRQGVTLTGLNTSKFEMSMEGIGAIFCALDQDVRAASHVLNPWSPGQFQCWSTITISNNYFSTGPYPFEHVDFDSTMDPNGLLARIDKNQFHHTVENCVGYFERVPKADKGYKYDYFLLAMTQSIELRCLSDTSTSLLKKFQSATLLKHD